MRYYLLFVGLIVFILSYYIFFSPTHQLQQSTKQPDRNYKSSIQYPTTPVTLTYWRIYDTPTAFDAIVADYHKLHPNITVNVAELDPGSYDAKLATAAQSGTLPDMFAIRNDWLARYHKSAVAAPGSVFTPDSYKAIFAPLPAQELMQDNKILGLTYSLPTLALYYNTQLFTQARVSDPPKDWQQLLDVNAKLSQKQGPALYKSGIALGTAAINNSVDILSVLMMQNGTAMTNQPPTAATFDATDTNAYNPGAAATAYYTSFSNPGKTSYSWSDALGGSVQAFAGGKTAMLIDYPFQASVIKAANPNLNFKTAQLPQLNSTNPLNYSQYVAELVSSNSKNQELAWDFLAYASSYDEMSKYAKVTGRVASRPDLAYTQESDPVLGPFAKQVVSATDWHQGYDANASEQAIRDAISTVQIGYDPAIALRLAAPKVTTEIQKR